jgi:hypothetical protein
LFKFTCFFNEILPFLVLYMVNFFRLGFLDLNSKLDYCDPT